jgi:hypothetical protein
MSQVHNPDSIRKVLLEKGSSQLAVKEESPIEPVLCCIVNFESARLILAIGGSIPTSRKNTVDFLFENGHVSELII